MAADTVELRYAGFWWRVIATMIDSVITGMLVSLFGYPFYWLVALLIGVILDNFFLGILVGFVWIVIWSWLYSALLESSDRQGTIGKMVCGIYVTDRVGHRISFLRASGRFFAKTLSMLILLIGFLMVAFSRRKRGLHDILAGTLVVRQVAPTRRLCIVDEGQVAYAMEGKVP